MFPDLILNIIFEYNIYALELLFYQNPFDSIWHRLPILKDVFMDPLFWKYIYDPDMFQKLWNLNIRPTFSFLVKHIECESIINICCNLNYLSRMESIALFSNLVGRANGAHMLQQDCINDYALKLFIDCKLHPDDFINSDLNFIQDAIECKNYKLVYALASRSFPLPQKDELDIMMILYQAAWEEDLLFLYWFLENYSISERMGEEIITHLVNNQKSKSILFLEQHDLTPRSSKRLKRKMQHVDSVL